MTFRNPAFRAIELSENPEELGPGTERESPSPIAYFRLGTAEYALGRYQSASEAFLKGLDITPGNKDLKYALTQTIALVAKSQVPADPPGRKSLLATAKRW